MKTCIVAVNSKYIHTALAPWYLKAYCFEQNIEVLEFNINQDMGKILHQIVKSQPDVLAFSCYIFNINIMKDLAVNIKKILPNVKIIFGGPEVSFNPEQVLTDCGAVDFIICGEGEEIFKQLNLYLSSGCVTSIEAIRGIVYRALDGLIVNPPALPIENLDSIPSPYTDEMLSRAKGKIIYFEASRGCPFSCSYCLSGIDEGVRFFSFERIKRDLIKILHSDIKQIKFVDRTFNCNLKRANELFAFIIDIANGDIDIGIHPAKIRGLNFHFEMAADFFDETMFAILSKSPVGFIQFEIGIQSLSEKTLSEVNRKTNIIKSTENIKKIIAMDNIHIFLDLIAGLPFEDFSSFKESFNGLYTLKPHYIQIGFLKFLKGSRIEKQAARYDSIYCSNPPYEILQNKFISYDELWLLKGIEDLVDSYYNSGKFKNALHFIIDKYSSAFDFFFDFSLYLQKNSPPEHHFSLSELYHNLLHFVDSMDLNQYMAVFNELLKYDYFSSDNSNNPPKEIKRILSSELKKMYIDLLKANKTKNVTSTSRLHIEIFSINPVLYSKQGVIIDQETILVFDYETQNPVTGEYNCFYFSSTIT